MVFSKVHLKIIAHLMKDPRQK
uniref:Uncharacterized protein n=1 Tax=Anguilla anguilla TaxID=7936 RepID=A0A0E9VTV4_ANGAN